MSTFVPHAHACFIRSCVKPREQARVMHETQVFEELHFCVTVVRRKAVHRHLRQRQNGDLETVTCSRNPRPMMGKNAVTRH